MHDDDGEHDGRFELYRSDGKEWFRLIWRDQVLLRSHGASTRDEAIAVVDRLQSSSTSIRACMTASGRFYFTAQIANGAALATSPSFELPAERDAAMATATRLLRAGPRTIRVIET